MSPGWIDGCRLGEMLGAMKVVTFYAWEDHFASEISAVRQRQKESILKYSVSCAAQNHTR